MTQDCAGFWFVCKAHPPAHIGICVGGCNAVDGPKNKQDVSLFLAAALRTVFMMKDLYFGLDHLFVGKAQYIGQLVYQVILILVQFSVDVDNSQRVSMMSIFSSVE